MKPLVASFSLFNTWAICPHQTYRRYIARDLPRQPETPEQKWGNEVHRAMERRIREKAPLPENMLSFEPLVAPLDAYHVEPEKKLGVTAAGRPCDFFADDVWLRGVLDAPVLLNRSTVKYHSEVSANEDANCVMLLDWKTGKPREEPLELEIGAMVLQAHWPKITRILGAYVWLRENRRGSPHDLSRTDRTWGFAQRTMGEINDAIEHRHFPKTRGPLCGWCPVTDCEHNRHARY